MYLLVREESFQVKYSDLLDIFDINTIQRILFEATQSSIYFIGESIIKFFVRCSYKHQPEVDEKGRPLFNQTTPLHHAAELWYNWKYNVIHELFKIYDRVDVNYTDPYGVKLFHIACLCGCYNIVKKFLELGQDPDDIVPKQDDSKFLFGSTNYLKSLKGKSPLLIALEQKHKHVVELLLRKGADPNYACEKDLTPLHIVCDVFGHDEGYIFAKIFFEVHETQRSVQVDAQDYLKRSPLHYLVSHGSKKSTMQLMVRNGANPNVMEKDGSTPLHILCMRDAIDELVETFFKICDEENRKILVNVQDHLGRTPLHYSLVDGCKKTIVKTLLRRGADPNLAGADAMTPVHILCMRDAIDELVETFFKICDEENRKILVNVQDNWGRTPLHYSLMDGCKKKIVKTLLRRGADPNLSDADAVTPLHIICMRDDIKDLAETFFKICDEQNRQVRIDPKDDIQRTPLHYVLYNSDKEMAEILLKRDADPNSADEDGLTPLHWICKRPDDNDDLAEMFFEACVKKKRRVRVNAQTSWGATPLHFALRFSETGTKKILKLLFKNGVVRTLPMRMD
ncbi:ankyrin-1-like [Trichogramma pretiosum]|uniref:ankyrin-1-like n=1 Tax=Trichogramma pretiosum TaxID=7493 RepID=UPI000C71C539|nr:ankyrin-1-like [Trichogramma pretiosum]